MVIFWMSFELIDFYLVASQNSQLINECRHGLYWMIFEFTTFYLVASQNSQITNLCTRGHFLDEF